MLSRLGARANQRDCRRTRSGSSGGAPPSAPGGPDGRRSLARRLGRFSTGTSRCPSRVPFPAGPCACGSSRRIPSRASSTEAEAPTAAPRAEEAAAAVVGVAAEAEAVGEAAAEAAWGAGQSVAVEDAAAAAWTASKWTAPQARRGSAAGAAEGEARRQPEAESY